MAAPDAQELELISQLRTRLADVTLNDDQKTDIFLVRWIRAREGNLDNAEQMLRQSLIWRKENDMDNISTWNAPEELLQICPAEFLGYDNENSPITYFPFGKWNLKKVVQIGEKETFIKFIDQMFERSLEKMKGKLTPSGLPVTTAVYISDADQLSMRTMASVGAVDMILQCVKRFEANQPETLRGMYILNAGTVFATLFALMKPLLSQRTFGKMQIFNACTPRCLEVLKSHIPIDVLPVRFGGENKNFRDIYAESPATADTGPEPEFIAITVPAGDKVVLAFSVDEVNSTISWAFRTEKYDIAFAVNCEGKGYVDNARVNSHEKLQEGSITCDTTGDYVVTFDNTYSRLRTKSLLYRIDVKTPEGVKQVLF